MITGSKLLKGRAMDALYHMKFLLVLFIWLAWDSLVAHGLRLVSYII